MTVKGQSITPATWIPLGIACTIILAAVGGTYAATTAWNRQAYEFQELKREVRDAVSRVNKDLASQSRSRWSSPMEDAAWNEFKIINQDLHVRIPDTRTIKQRLDP